MLKALRKYNKIILVVGGSLLMVVFLLPAGIGQMIGAGPGATVAVVDGRKVSLREMELASREMGLAVQVLNIAAPMIGLDPRDPPALWIMRTAEATRGGFVGGPRDGRAFIPEAASLRADFMIVLASRQFGAQAAAEAQRRRPEMIASFTLEAEMARERAILSGFTPDQADLALAKAHGLYRMVQAVSPLSLLSRPEAVQLASTIIDSATVGAVIIPAFSLAENLPEPDEDRISEHFERYRTVRAGEDPSGIGYARPAAISVEWMSIDRLAFLNSLVLDPIETNKFWRQNRTRFPGEFTAVRESVAIAHREAETERALSRAEEIVRREVFRSVEGLPGTSQKRVLPPDWQSRMPRLTAIGEAVERAVEGSFTLSAADRRLLRVFSPTDFMSANEVAGLPGIGQSQFRMSEANIIPFGTLAFAAQELGGDPRFGIQEGMIHGPLRDRAGNMYFFRIARVRQPGPPDSIDDVRSRVIDDIKTLDAMKLLAEQAEVFRERAMADGLSVLAGTYGASAQWDLEVTAFGVINRGEGFGDARLNAAPFRDAVMEAARGLDPTVDPIPADEPGRFVAVVLPSAKGLAVAQIQRWRPLTIEQFRESAPFLRNQIVAQLDPPDPMANFEMPVVAMRVRVQDRAGLFTSGDEELDQSGDNP